MAIGIIFAAVSLISSVVGMYAQQQAQAQQAKIAEYNAKMAELRGEAEADAIEAQAEIKTKETRRELSRTHNILANAGLDISTGSPLLTLTKQYADDNADRNEMFRQAEISRITGSHQRLSYQMQADATKRAQSMSLISGGIGAVAGAGSAYYKGSLLETKLDAAKTVAG